MEHALTAAATLAVLLALLWAGAAVWVIWFWFSNEDEGADQ